MEKKALLIFNSKAGTGTAGKNLPGMIEDLTAGGYLVTAVPVIGDTPLSVEKVLEDHHQEFDVLAVCGGDGTLNHITNKLMEIGADLPVGYVPNGSANDFSKSLYEKEHISAREICSYIISGKTRRCDLGRFNSRYFNYVAAFGAFTEVSYTTPQDMKNAIGYAAYVLEVFSKLKDDINYNQHVKVIHDGIETEGDYLFGFVSNSISVAGMKSSFIADSSLDDGYLELTLISVPNNAKELGELIGAAASGDTNSKYIYSAKFKNAQFIFRNPVSWTLDGEDGGEHSEVRVEIQEKKLQVFAAV